VLATAGRSSRRRIMIAQLPDTQRISFAERFLPPANLTFMKDKFDCKECK
jgi:hypothetical protein